MRISGGWTQAEVVRQRKVEGRWVRVKVWRQWSNMQIKNQEDNTKPEFGGPREPEAVATRSEIPRSVDRKWALGRMRAFVILA